MSATLLNEYGMVWSRRLTGKLPASWLLAESVYVMVRRLSVCLSRRSTAALQRRAAGLPQLERGQQISTDSCLRPAVPIDNCWQRGSVAGSVML